MRQSKLVTKTSRDISKEELSINAQLLTRAGFIDRLAAGIYSYLPLGMRVLAKIEEIIRQEMTAVGGQEVLMPALHPKEVWEQTGRWDTVDILFRTQGAGDRDFALGPTHEEVVTPLVGRFVSSYKDLPASVFQIQTKFRNEPRAKSGLLRGREFRMKDMYSFHTSQDDLDAYYEVVKEAYHRVFARCGLGDMTYVTYASGGMFSKYSHEFQTLTPNGEDHIHVWKEKRVAVNREIFDEIKSQDEWKGATFEESKAIEVGNIFKLGSRFSDAFNLAFQDQSGKRQQIVMGCYGIGSTRLVGAVVEVFNDERGMRWPQAIAPYHLHLVSLARTDDDQRAANELYEALLKAGIEVLFDDRPLNPGEKFADCDLVGLPFRAVISPRTLKDGAVELKGRGEEQARNVPIAEFTRWAAETLAKNS